MIQVWRSRDDAEFRAVQSALTESCLAHEVVERESVTESLRPATAGVVLIDDGVAYRGAAEILPHLEELVLLRDRWHKYGSDACYCDDEGNIE